MVKFIIIFCLFLNNCFTPILQEESLIIKLNKAINYIEDNKYSRAIEELKYIIMSDPLSTYASDAQFYLSESYFYSGNYNQAILEYDYYLNRGDKLVKFIKKTQYMLCQCYFNISLDYNKDQSSTNIAIEKLQYYIEKENMSQYKDEIEEMILKLRTKLAKKDFNTAKLYVRLEEYKAANIYFNSIINNYYDTDFVNNAIINIALLYYSDDAEKAILFVKNHRNNFLNEENYNSAFLFITSIESNQNYDYYLDLLR